jgi:hypothetical protein
MSITALAGMHLRYALMNDEGKITLWPNGTQQQADVAEQFLKQIIVAGIDIGSSVNFSDAYYLDVANETDPRKIVTSLARTGRSGTSLYDAVIATAKYLAQQTVSTEYRKVIFLFCDGEDNKSVSSFNQVAEVLQTGAIPIFIVAPSRVESKSQGKSLRKLATQTGGRAYFLPQNTSQVSFEFLKRDLAQSFLLKISIPGFQGKAPLRITYAANQQTIADLFNDSSNSSNYQWN